MASRTGAIGSALLALGGGAEKHSERGYKEQLQEKLAAAKEKRENNLLKRRELFEIKQAQVGQESALERIQETGKERRKTEAAKPVKPVKSPSFQTFKISDPMIIDGEEVKDKEVKARFDSGSPNVGLGPGWVPVSKANFNDPGSTELMGHARGLQKDYARESKLITLQERSVETLRDFLTETPDSATTHAIQNELAKLFSNQSRAIKEVEAWGNLGNLVQRFSGGLKKFTTGSLLESQYKDIEKLVDKFAETTLPKFRSSLDESYTKQAEFFKVPPETILRKSLQEMESVETEKPAAAKAEKVGPKSAEQIDEDAAKFGWDVETTQRVKSQWGFADTGESVTRFR